MEQKIKYQVSMTKLWPSKLVQTNTQTDRNGQNHEKRRNYRYGVAMCGFFYIYSRMVKYIHISTCSTCYWFGTEKNISKQTFSCILVLSSQVADIAMCSVVQQYYMNNYCHGCKRNKEEYVQLCVCPARRPKGQLHSQQPPSIMYGLFSDSFLALCICNLHIYC